jgi:hypothetical protein
MHSLRHEIIYKDDKFGNEQLKNNTFIIGGISSRVIRLTDDKRIFYTLRLTNILKDKIDDINIITNQLVSQIGKGKFVKIMKKFDSEKNLKKETMRFIGDTLPNANYIIFAYIEFEDMIVEKLSEEYIKDEDGKEELQITYNIQYYLDVEFQIYDILLERMIWNSLINNVAKWTVKKTERSIITIFGKDIFDGEQKPPDPAKIKKRERFLEKYFEKFSDDLAEIKK